jgi:hypothetical protein
MSNPKLHWQPGFASGSLIPAFAKVPAETIMRMLESENWRGCRASGGERGVVFIVVRQLNNKKCPEARSEINQGNGQARSGLPVGPPSTSFHPVRGLRAGSLRRPLRRLAASVVDLTFDSVLPRLLKSNFKSKATLESSACWCPFGSDIRK